MCFICCGYKMPGFIVYAGHRVKGTSDDLVYPIFDSNTNSTKYI